MDNFHYTEINYSLFKNKILLNPKLIQKIEVASASGNYLDLDQDSKVDFLDIIRNQSNFKHHEFLKLSEIESSHFPIIYKVGHKEETYILSFVSLEQDWPTKTLIESRRAQLRYQCYPEKRIYLYVRYQPHVLVKEEYEFSSKELSVLGFRILDLSADGLSCIVEQNDSEILADLSKISSLYLTIDQVVFKIEEAVLQYETGLILPDKKRANLNRVGLSFKRNNDIENILRKFVGVKELLDQDEKKVMELFH